MTAKEGGPSRDWLDPRQHYVVTSRAKTKIKQYFSAQDEEELLIRGRSFVAREMQRDGHAQANIEGLADRLGFKNADALYVAAGRGEVGPRAVQMALREADAPAEANNEPEMVVGRSRTGDNSDKILIVGVGKLLTSLSRCCKPAPPDAIEGFVTRGRGISIHRVDCHDFQLLARQQPERVIAAEWGDQAYNNRQAVFPVDVAVREKLNVTAVNTLTKKGTAFMRFTMEVGGITQLQRAITLIREVNGVIDAQRK
jgi:GTP pyrophosphokinase